MFFHSLHDFLAMGGYAAYVWSAFGITFFSLFVLSLLSVKRHKRILDEVRQQQARETRIERAKTMENTL
ncbi:heme exporter protein CcmD [Vibrio palustris]|uniref:Heme exporter protein D n=1 Tax=Vibrio palustris TaxID=1918946 RepID=A0A1R4B0F8_9VIBR|nr:heme exporter protein CcmD [Vibrio palustris]SJL82405.1 Heme exporter protein D [Vibrio palustris]